jgi:N6-adenosine-specific RNA methylase IME4
MMLPRAGGGITGLNRAADNHYPAMTLAQILTHPLPATENCFMFMWIVTELDDKYPQILVSKASPSAASASGLKVPSGLGHWFRFAHETLVVAVKGEVPAPAPGENWGAEFLEDRATTYGPAG